METEMRARNSFFSFLGIVASLLPNLGYLYSKKRVAFCRFSKSDVLREVRCVRDCGWELFWVVFYFLVL